MPRNTHMPKTLYQYSYIGWTLRSQSVTQRSSVPKQKTGDLNSDSARPLGNSKPLCSRLLSVVPAQIRPVSPETRHPTASSSLLPGLLARSDERRGS